MRRLADLGPLIPIFGAFASICAAGTYLDRWTYWWVVADCGDRLEEILNAGSDVAAVCESDEYESVPDGLTPEQIFGLRPRLHAAATRPCTAAPRHRAPS